MVWDRLGPAVLCYTVDKGTQLNPWMSDRRTPTTPASTSTPTTPLYTTTPPTAGSSTPAPSATPPERALATPPAAALPTAAAVAAAGSGWTAVTARLRALRSELEETALRLANAERVRHLYTLSSVNKPDLQ